ncbi:hypothetical protein [Oligosphaera ethanolica]|uniref:Uncharacterized protein n=1 Tax=Oligosphaera ethanolica TaxID=760260 RepID=A0AAE3VIJ9_9BACT|nr:hypothetical protein [Oligosphaera ethanolica]MDQ0291119.1 hypothetical protein [Oligosphaera ethanolica]
MLKQQHFTIPHNELPENRLRHVFTGFHPELPTTPAKIAREAHPMLL